MTTESLLESVEREMSPSSTADEESGAARPVVVIERRRGWRTFDPVELWAYRDLFWFLTWRMIRVRYAQSAVGIGWAVLQPLLTTLIFTVVFGHFAQIDSEGSSYLLFSFAAMIPWTFFANAVTEGTNSLVQSADMISKVYFPRVILPLSAVTAKLLDMAIALLVFTGVMLAQGRPIKLTWCLLPGLIIVLMLTAAGVCLWLSALAIQYRDVKHALPFVIQLLMYVAPVVYPASAVPRTWSIGGWSLPLRACYALNPLVGIIEGFRAVVLGTREIPWDWCLLALLMSSVLFMTGALYFRAKERLFADVA